MDEKMTERERLAKLILAAMKWEYDTPDEIAERLLDNGVICPPCKVGDVVYRITPNFLFVKEYDVVGFHLGDFPTLNGHKRKPYLVCYDKTSRYLARIPLEEIGKNVFLTREEAEAARAEGRKGC